MGCVKKSFVYVSAEREVELADRAGIELVVGCARSMPLVETVPILTSSRIHEVRVLLNHNEPCPRRDESGRTAMQAREPQLLTIVLELNEVIVFWILMS